MAIKVAGPAQETGGPGLSRVVGPGGAAWWLSAALAVTAAAGSLLTFTVPALLRGTAVMNGSARGTALVVLLAGVPALACSMLLAARGSAAAVITWLGAAGFLLYNSLMFVFATPANRLFPLYLAMLALAAWSIGAVLRQADVVAWIAVELLILRRYFFLQPVIAGIGAAEILLARRWQRSGKIVTGSRDQRP
jgi:hypothetical protein